MDYKFEKKFSERHIDEFVNTVYLNFKNNPKDYYYFNMIDTEWISNQELLVFTSILFFFKENNINYSIDFFEKGTYPKNNKRKALFLISLWETWKIYEVIPDYKYQKYLGLTEGLINSLKSTHNIQLLRKELYDNNNIVTPFQKLPYLSEYTDREIITYLDKYNSLEAATQEIIKQQSLAHPFLNKSFGSIIIKELYENFLDHFSQTVFKTQENYAFFSLSVKSKIRDTERSEKEISDILKLNFEQEKLTQTKSFFYNEKNNKFINHSYLEFSFLDFGNGIVETIKNNYDGDNDDSKILEYAFKPTSSKNPISKKHFTENNIPRGLFDIVAIVERYSGLMIVRSNYGKIIYDFSENKNFESAIHHFGDELYFPGNLISIYIPTLHNNDAFNSTRINPSIDFSNKNPSQIEKEKFISLYPIFNEIENLKLEKPESYQFLIQKLSKEIGNDKSTINYINLKGCQELDERLLKKAIFYLITDYKVNLSNNVIIVNPPNENFLEAIKNEIISLNEAVKSFVVQPLPFVYLESNRVLLRWLGVSSIEDEKKLNNLLFGEFNFSLVKSDFINPQEIIGQINYYDARGNLYSLLPSEDELINKLLKDLFINKNCIKSEGLYLCSGNYYQEQYIQLSNILSDKEDLDLVSKMLLNKINKKGDELGIDIGNCIFIGVTTSSSKILNQFKKINSKIKDEQIQLIDSYSFLNNEASKKIKAHKSYVLVCDAISTGYLTQRIEKIINSCQSKLSIISVITNLLDDSFEGTRSFSEKYSNNLIYLADYNIKKYRRKSLPKSLKKQLQKVIRINPYTNAPITFTINDTSYNKVLISNEKFIESLDNEDINIGFKKFNNLIHPYFFNLKKILKKENIKISTSNIADTSILKSTINKTKISSKRNTKIFYPKNSDIGFLNLDNFIINLLKGGNIEYFELERFQTSNGWKFPHISNHYESIINNNNILLLDDGSCSGDSLLQMINEVSYFNPESITLICIVGRVDDHKREFFSKINSVTTNNIKSEIFFSSYWSIPTFHLYKNPYSDEIIWLEKILNITNTPYFIEKITKNILREIKPRESEKFEDYKYLIPKKTSKHSLREDKFPKKEMTLIRDKIGQVVGYRYYKEGFDWFNNLIATLEDKTIKNAPEKYQNMELISMCILYEPYLYYELCKVMPDFKDKMEGFVETLIFGNPEKERKKIDLKNHLYYNWISNRKDIIHLLFIIFKNKDLLPFLEINFLKKLLNFSDSPSDINYILFKLLPYIVENRDNEVQSKIYESLKFIDKSSSDSLTNVKIFKQYISSLVTGFENDYDGQLLFIQSEIEKISDEKYHQSNIFSYKQEVIGLTVEIEKLLFKGKDFNALLGKVKNKIAPILKFIEELLSFTNQYPDFFIDKEVFYNIDKTANSLRYLYSLILSPLYGNTKDNNMSEFRDRLNAIFEEFILENSKVNKIFSRLSTSEPNTLLLDFLNNKKIAFEEFIEDSSDELIIDIPEYFFKLIFTEISNNFRYAEKGSINLSFKKCNNNFTIRIYNNISQEDVEKGSNLGMKVLKNTNNNFFDSSYLYGVRDNKYFQFINFKVL